MNSEMCVVFTLLAIYVTSKHEMKLHDADDCISEVFVDLSQTF